MDLLNYKELAKNLVNHNEKRVCDGEWAQVTTTIENPVQEIRFRDLLECEIGLHLKVRQRYPASFSSDEGREKAAKAMIHELYGSFLDELHLTQRDIYYGDKEAAQDRLTSLINKIQWRPENDI